MDPNSANQAWSKWVWFVVPDKGVAATPRSWDEVKLNMARFGRKAFGAASQMRIRKTLRGYIIEILSEGHPVHDATYTQYMFQNWDKFLRAGFGEFVLIKSRARLVAGSRQDGTPSDQLIMIPALSIQGDLNG